MLMWRVMELRMQHLLMLTQCSMPHADPQHPASFRRSITSLSTQSARRMATTLTSSSHWAHGSQKVQWAHSKQQGHAL